jgi:hypothetical protein
MNSRCVTPAAVGFLLMLSACASTPTDPLAVMLDREASPSRRIRAMEQAGALGREARRIETLHAIAWSDLQPTELRTGAMAQLIELDEPAFRAAATARITQIERWDALEYLMTTAADRGWVDFTPALVHNWARPSRLYADEQRPERIALQRLHPDTPIEQVLWDVLAGEDASLQLPHRVAAWAVLYRISEHELLTARLMALDADIHPLVADLQAAWRDMGVLPPNREQVAWLMHLRNPREVDPGIWAGAAAVLAQAHPEDRRGIRIRHIYPLGTDVGVTGLRRATGLAHLRERLRGARHYQRQPAEIQAALIPSESLDDHVDALSAADIEIMLRILGALRQPAVLAALFTQADADLLDTTTEYGGLLVDAMSYRGGWAYAAKAFKPYLTGNDHAFYAPPEMIPAMYTALAHYHFHANRYDNAAFAGPGGGDMAFADRFGAACLVLTFIDRNTLNVDYYHEGGVVIDLGCITRPH